MCFYSRQTKKAIELIKRYNTRIVNEVQFEIANEYNGFVLFPKPRLLPIKTKASSIICNGGSFPLWAKDDSVKQYTLNAKNRVVEREACFQRQHKKQMSDHCRRVFMNGNGLTKGKREKQKYLITLPRKNYFLLQDYGRDGWIKRRRGR